MSDGEFTAGPILKPGELFVIFLKAGMVFGGGLAIIGSLEEEFVRKRKLLTQEEFLTYYAIGRLIPSGTLTAMTAGFGYRFGGYMGSIVAMTALVLPAFVIIVAFAIMYGTIRDSALFSYLTVTILPAAIGLIVITAWRMGSEVKNSRFGLGLAIIAFVLVLIAGLHPIVVLMAGGVIGSIWYAPIKPVTEARNEIRQMANKTPIINRIGEGNEEEPR